MVRKTIFILSVFLVLSACKNSQKGSDDLEMPVIDGEEEPLEVADETMEEMVQNVSSPIEMAALIKSLGVPFSKNYLATTDFVDNYVTSSKQAFALGVFGADMGYLNMYEKTTSVIDYLSAIKSLADEINVGQFFDFPTLKRLATNSQNIDSLMYISVHSFNQMDKYLRENKRGNLSSLMISGVWVEGLYLGTQVAKTTDNANLAERIGEQKTVLSQLLLILQNYSNDQFVKKLIEDLNGLKEDFKDIEISIEYGEPEAREVNGELVIIQNEKSIVHITDEQLESITNKTKVIRDKLINL
jgi:hypothetical protein